MYHTDSKAQSIRQYEPAPAPEQSTEMADELQRLDNHLSGIESTVHALNARLGPVLRPIPVAAQKADQTGGGLSPLGGTLRNFTERVVAAQHQLACLLEALAV